MGHPWEEFVRELMNIFHGICWEYGAKKKKNEYKKNETSQTKTPF